jgi:DNA-binding NarL/FixJ family response regulator
VAAGDIWVGRGVTSELVQFLRVQNSANDNGTPRTPDTETPQAPAAMPENRFGLTKRELQIVNALVEAQTNKDIAETCRISEFTVKHHLTNIFDKLGVYNRVELALFAIHHQLCPSGVRHPLLATEKPGA